VSLMKTIALLETQYFNTYLQNYFYFFKLITSKETNVQTRYSSMIVTYAFAQRAIISQVAHKRHARKILLEN
jgi:hypothetical protein